MGKYRNLIAFLVLANGIVFTGRILYAIALTVSGTIAQLWMPAEEVGSVMWAYSALINWSKSIPYLIWGSLAAIVAAWLLVGQPTTNIKTIFLAIAVCLWGHCTELAIFSWDHWQYSWALEVHWIVIFFPLFWFMPNLLKRAELYLLNGGRQ
jgi:hypothetical protein